jgi:CDP-6-deoxy-D-xylo-4-hexulose-3-dehydrase
MFESMTREEAAKAILESVREYYRHFMRKPAYKDGDRISYAGRVFDEEEMACLADSSLEFWLTSGRYTEQFEKHLAEYLNISFCSLVNSGSSANLIAFMALTSPLLKDRAIQRGDEVITVAAGFPTTVTPVLQYGAVPVFLDVTIPQYNIDVSLLEKALSPKTKAVMIAHTMGNPFDIKAVKSFCDAHNLWLVEDNCDALGAAYTVNGVEKLTGTFGDIGTSSFYPAHHITMGEGGAVYTNNPTLHKLVRSFRDWGRDCMCPSGVDNLCGHRYDNQYGELPPGYDHKFVYSHFGYNLKATDMQAAIGCAQMGKLASFVERRRHNWKRLYSGFQDLQDKLILPEPAPDSNPSWFGFLITCKKSVDRNGLVQHIEKNNIQTRMLFAGNLVKHPCFDEIRKTGAAYRVAGNLDTTDRIMRDTFWVGVYPGMTDAMIDRTIAIVRDYVKAL